MRVSIALLALLSTAFAAKAQCLCEVGSGCECKKCQCDLLSVAAKGRWLTYDEGAQIAVMEDKPFVVFVGPYNLPYAITGAVVCHTHALEGYKPSDIVVSEPDGKGWLSWYKTFRFDDKITLPTKAVPITDIRGIIPQPTPTLFLRQPAQCVGPNCPQR